MKSSEKVPCNFDHNGECLICDCWISNCAYIRMLDGDYKYESKEELEDMFKYIINKDNPKKMNIKQTAVELLKQQLETCGDPGYCKIDWETLDLLFEQAKLLEKEQIIDFGEFIIDELEPMYQNREWVEERYNYFKSE